MGSRSLVARARTGLHFCAIAGVVELQEYVAFFTTSRDPRPDVLLVPTPLTELCVASEEMLSSQQKRST